MRSRYKQNRTLQLTSRRGSLAREPSTKTTSAQLILYQNMYYAHRKQSVFFVSDTGLRKHRRENPISSDCCSAHDPIFIADKRCPMILSAYQLVHTARFLSEFLCCDCTASEVPFVGIRHFYFFISWSWRTRSIIIADKKSDERSDFYLTKSWYIQFDFSPRYSFYDRKTGPCALGIIER